MKLLHLVGNSGSGKDTVASIISSNTEAPVEVIKFSRGFKGCLEHLYNLPEYSLDYPETKAQKVPGMELTFLEVLILGWSDSQKTIFGQVWLSYAANKIQTALDKGHIVILTDLRQEYEADLILNNPDWLSQYAQVMITGRGQALESDAHIQHMAASLLNRAYLKEKRGVYRCHIVNSGSMESLEKEIKRVMNYLGI